MMNELSSECASSSVFLHQERFSPSGRIGCLIFPASLFTNKGFTPIDEKKSSSIEVHLALPLRSPAIPITLFCLPALTAERGDLPGLNI